MRKKQILERIADSLEDLKQITITLEYISRYLHSIMTQMQRTDSEKVSVVGKISTESNPNAPVRKIV